MRYAYEIIKPTDNGYESVEIGNITSDKDYGATYDELLNSAKEKYGSCMLSLKTANTIIDDLVRYERIKSMMAQRSVFAA